MMKRILAYSFCIFLMLALVGCGGKGGAKVSSGSSQLRKFPPLPAPPAVVTDPEAIAEYQASAFWCEFLDPAKAFPCDSNVVNGVAAEEVESALGLYVTLLENRCSRSSATKAIDEFFSLVERFQTANPSSNVYSYFEKQVEHYLYDPNSPVRDEDLYQVYVSRLAESELTDEDMKWAYSHDSQMCLLNQVGTRAADFVFTDLRGKRKNLYGIEAEWTLLFFSNPGCPNCREIVDQLETDPVVAAMMENGSLAVVNIYIDEELDKWREYASTYPEAWYTGYDHTHKIRQDLTYNVRAIPSLYLLDRDKTVLMKDAPSDKVVEKVNALGATRETIE